MVAELLLAVALASAPTPAAQPLVAPEYGRAYLDRDRKDVACTLASVIAAVHATPPPTDRKPFNRFVALDTPDPKGYVQCLFQDGDSWMICEASSGWYDQGVLNISVEQRRRIAVLGFDTMEREGNFQKAVRTPDAVALQRTASLLLETFDTVYRTDADRTYRIHAPLLGDDTQVLADRGCGSVAAP